MLSKEAVKKFLYKIDPHLDLIDFYETKEGFCNGPMACCARSVWHVVCAYPEADDENYDPGDLFYFKIQADPLWIEYGHLPLFTTMSDCKDPWQCVKIKDSHEYKRLADVLIYGRYKKVINHIIYYQTVRQWSLNESTYHETNTQIVCPHIKAK